MQQQRGTGPGVITPDGCAVDLYAVLPTRGEPEIVATAVSPKGTILDLGSGSGRIADPLSRMGFQVVAVDNSPEMLGHVQVAETVLAEIGGLNLGREFDAVLLTSHLVNVPSADDRGGFLATAARHTRTGGSVIVEWHPPIWFDDLHTGDTQHGVVGGVAVGLHVHSHQDGLLHATVTYRCGSDVWTQTFTAARLTLAELDAALITAGFSSARSVTPDGHWLSATRR